MLDAAPLYRLALEKGPAGARYHAVAEEGVTARAIAEAIGRGLKIPVVSKSPEEAAGHFGWLGFFVGCGRPGVERADAGAAGMAPDAEGRDDRRPRPHELVGGVSPFPSLLSRLTVSEGRHVSITPISPPGRKTKAFSPWILRVKP